MRDVFYLRKFAWQNIVLAPISTKTILPSPVKWSRTTSVDSGKPITSLKICKGNSPFFAGQLQLCGFSVQLRKVFKAKR
jgi:hypothetical protein